MHSLQHQAVSYHAPTEQLSLHELAWTDKHRRIKIREKLASPNY